LRYTEPFAIVYLVQRSVINKVTQSALYKYTIIIVISSIIQSIKYIAREKRRVNYHIQYEFYKNL